MAGSGVIAFFAGLLSILSPCVLPLIPIVLGTAVSEHRLGPVALAAGLAVSFVSVGLFVATIGFAIGIDTDRVRFVSAVMMLVVGVVLAVPRLQRGLATSAGPVGDWADRRLGWLRSPGLTGQFGVGILLGMVWSPCVGPTLGAASLLAAQGQNLGDAALTMALFGIGAALPLLGLGFLSRATLMRWRGPLMRAGGGIRAALGVMLGGIAAAILLGADRTIEAFLVAASPIWLTNLTTML